MSLPSGALETPFSEFVSPEFFAEFATLSVSLILDKMDKSYSDLSACKYITSISDKMERKEERE